MPHKGGIQRPDVYSKLNVWLIGRNENEFRDDCRFQEFNSSSKVLEAQSSSDQFIARNPGESEMKRLNPGFDAGSEQGALVSVPPSNVLRSSDIENDNV